MKRIAACIAIAALAAAAPGLAQAPAAPAANQFGPGMRSVKIEATDFQKSIAFYTALGMKAGVKRDTTQDLVWEGTTQNSGIIMTTSEYARNAKMVRGGTYLMIMTPDVKAVADKLRKAGYPDVAEPRAMGTMVTVLMLKDPDGNQIEMLSAPPN